MPTKIGYDPSSQWVERWEVESHSSDTAYIVAVHRNGTWGCSCPRWIYGRKTHGDCKHIREVQGYVARHLVVEVQAPKRLHPEQIARTLDRFAMVEV